MQSNARAEKYIDIDETVSLLGVSSATVRNWIRHQYLTPHTHLGNKMLFKFLEIQDLKQKIVSGEINRLSKRANKRHSTSLFIPEEYAENRDLIDLVQRIINKLNAECLDKNTLLFSIILNFLRDRKLVSFDEVKSESDIACKNDVIKEEIKWWYEKTDGRICEDKYNELFFLGLPFVDDVLGLIYQSIRFEGSKAEAGAYYTPKQIVNEIVNDCVKVNSLVLDPCCGTGQFLLSALDIVKDPTKVWGFDIDETAVRLARINLLVKFPALNFTPNIFCKNALLIEETNNLFSNENIPLFDAVITNPPWGVHFSQVDSEKLKRIYPNIKSGESFSYFIETGLRLLKKGGFLSFVLPESILNVKVHKDIRSAIIHYTTIREIKYLNRIFKNVFTPVIKITLQKAETNNNEFVAISGETVCNVDQSRLKNNSDYTFDVFTNNYDISVFDKVYSLEHITLSNNAEWALGVVTGNNREYLLDRKSEDCEPILTGKNIKKFVTTEPDNFIKFAPEKFQQVAPEYKFRAKEKLIYKFISKELIFCYDENQTLTLNSANILIPKIKNYPIKTILALFNSTLYQFLFQKKFGALKVLKGDLERLPLPVISEQSHQRIEKLVNKLLEAKLSKSRLKDFQKLDEYISDIFSLSKKENDYIKENVKLSKNSIN